MPSLSANVITNYFKRGSVTTTPAPELSLVPPQQPVPTEALDTSRPWQLSMQPCNLEDIPLNAATMHPIQDVLKLAKHRFVVVAFCGRSGRCKSSAAFALTHAINPDNNDIIVLTENIADLAPEVEDHFLYKTPDASFSTVLITDCEDAEGCLVLRDSLRELKSKRAARGMCIIEVPSVHHVILKKMGTTIFDRIIEFGNPDFEAVFTKLNATLSRFGIPGVGRAIMQTLYNVDPGNLLSLLTRLEMTYAICNRSFPDTTESIMTALAPLDASMDSMQFFRSIVKSPLSARLLPEDNTYLIDVLRENVAQCAPSLDAMADALGYISDAKVMSHGVLPGQCSSTLFIATEVGCIAPLIALECTVPKTIDAPSLLNLAKTIKENRRSAMHSLISGVRSFVGEDEDYTFQSLSTKRDVDIYRSQRTFHEILQMSRACGTDIVTPKITSQALKRVFTLDADEHALKRTKPQKAPKDSANVHLAYKTIVALDAFPREPTIIPPTEPSLSITNINALFDF